MLDVIFLAYALLFMPLVSLIYFAYAFTHFDGIVIAVGAAVLWLVLIPYPLSWYLKKRVFIQS
jgi:ABC-type iron transport system FetAB permease component